MSQIKKIDNKDMESFNPVRMYLNYLTAEYLSGIREHMSNSPPIKNNIAKITISKGLKSYVRKTVESFLIGDKRLLAEYYLRKDLWPKKISLKFKSFPPRVYDILLNQRVQRGIDLMALTGNYSVTDMAVWANDNFYKGSVLSAQVISKYLYLFWGVMPSEDQEPLDPARTIQFLTSDRQLSSVFAEHIRIATGEQSPFELSTRLGLNEEISKQLNNEVYQGFAMAIVRKNDAVFSGRTEEADLYSKIMIRDSQVLRNLGHRPKKRALRDSVKVIYDKED